MFILNLKGGLGNQMFQYALAKSLSLKWHEDFKLDLSGYQQEKLRCYELDIFPLVAARATPAEIKAFKYPHGLLSKLERKFAFKILHRHHTGWEPAILKTNPRHHYLDGYWQSYKYFESIAETIRQDFRLPSDWEQIDPDLTTKIKSQAAVSLHIRRSDYAQTTNLKNLGVCPLSYYEQAVALIAAKVSHPIFFIFSDDPIWAEANLKLDYPHLSVSMGQRFTNVQELAMMSACANHIIANSSFSWWGAWLDPKPNKIVIAPKPWFNDNSVIPEDIIPPTWITLSRLP